MAKPLGIPNALPGTEALGSLEKEKVKVQATQPRFIGVRPIRAPALHLPLNRPELGHTTMKLGAPTHLATPANFGQPKRYKPAPVPHLGAAPHIPHFRIGKI